VSAASPGLAGQGAGGVQAAQAARLGVIRHLFGAVRVRLFLIVFIAAVPLVMLSATIVWQNYRLALSVTAETAARLRESAAARHVAAVTGAQQLMQALAEVADLAGGDEAMCNSRLATLLRLQSARYTNLAVLGADGSVRCSALPMTATLREKSGGMTQLVLARARARRGFALGQVRPSLLTGLQIIPAAFPIMHGGAVSGFVYAGLRLDWFFNPAGLAIPVLPALWIVDSAGNITQLAGQGSVGLPSAEIVTQLERTASVVDAASLGGAPFSYASSALGDDYTLIVADPASNDRKAARNLLIRRVVQLGLLLLLGLAGVAIGVHVALCRPLTLLSRAVAEWRSTGNFDPAYLGDPPREVHGLAASFAAAVTTLAEQEQRLRVSVEQQELLMREIHHRVKNNLQIVASLLNLQASRIRMPEAKAEFASARDRVRALATLHRHLYAHGEVHTINMPDFLTELCGQLFQAMGEIEGQRIKLTIEASPLQMSSDQAVPLSLIVTEAVSNALKYAFPHGRTGHVLVRLTADGETATLVVQDNGIGMPSGTSESEHGVRDGIGITLIRGFARQLAAELTVEEEAGTRYTLRMTLRHDVGETEMAT
jgi:two-component sensor histidine kinase